jgi:outer membrane protein TolC
MIKSLIFTVIIFGVKALMAESVFFTELDLLREKNFDLQASEQNKFAAREYARAKKLFWTPNLNLSGGINRQSVNAPLSEATDNPFWKLSSSINLFGGGSDYHLKQAANYQMEAAENHWVNETLKTDSENANIIFQQLYINDLVQAAEKLAQLKDESYHIVLSKYKGGQVPIQEVEKSEVDKSQAETRLRNLKLKDIENQIQWKSAYSVAMQTSNWPFSVITKLKNIETSTLVESSEAFSMPDLNRLSNLSLAAESYWKASKSQFWPQIDFGIDYIENANSALNNKVWQGGLTLTFPLWNRYESVAQSSLKYAEFFSAKKQLERALSAQKAKQDRLIEKLFLSRKNLEVAQENLKKSERLYTDMLKSFKFGRLSMNELLMEQARLIDVQESVSQSQWDYHKAVVDSCLLMGEKLKNCLQ